MIHKFTGLLYGLVLAFFSSWIMGGGHGTYVPFAVFSSPLGFAGILFAVCAMPLFWMVVGLFAANANHKWPKMLFLITIVIHYAAIPFLLELGDYGDWEYFFKYLKDIPIAGIMMAGFLIYLFGQIRLWRTFVTTTQPLD